ncbi:MAG: hypothetical protein HY262_08715 [Chloroflexi bacterium]|nr:hypothetical protein [Chloroflexota bacterium]
MSMATRGVGLAVILLFVLAACQPATASPSPAATTPGPAASSEPPPSAETSSSTEASPPAPAGQTDTAWGRIWDSLPAAFPAYPGATPAEGAATGPASAVLAIQGAEAETVAGWMQSKLEQATYSTEALSGPLEDGSYVLDSTGPAPGCRVRVSIAPLGGLTTVTVLYGADCPKP